MANDQPIVVGVDEESSPERRRRSALPWILLGVGGALLLALGIAVVAFVIPTTVGTAADPAASVQRFDRAYAAVDCAQFESVTTESFREISHGSDEHGIFDCATWEAIATEYTVDGAYLYDLEVLDTSTEADRAFVSTHEVDGRDGSEYDYTYTLVPDVDGIWVIDSIVETES
ncbi:hypothetical protein [uncultured Schumannella sp.]|jgi:hypothetical protein|uniref:hypothetical protein n=1 Tax=uncultured Schumannella sp. TaxID=1195956 RepID=UPI0025EF6F96|nr:hypothetical protein [uncultured Schumannella sp.]